MRNDCAAILPSSDRYAHKSLHNLQESDIFRMRFLAGLARKLLRLFLPSPFNGADVVPAGQRVVQRRTRPGFRPSLSFNPRSVSSLAAWRWREGARTLSERHVADPDPRSAVRRQPVRRAAAVQRPQRRSLAGWPHRARLRGAGGEPLSPGRRRRRGPLRHPLGASAGAAIHVAHGRLRLAVLADRLGHGRAGGAVRALLHVAGRSGATLLFLLPGLHGRHAGRGAVRQSDPAGDVLGNDQPGLVHADRLLAPSPGRAARRAWRSPSPARAGCACWPAC